MATVTSLKFDITSGWSGDGVDDAQAQLAALKSQIDDLNSQKIQISADTAEVNAQIAQVKQQIDSIKGQVGVTIDDADAIEQIDALKAELASLNSQKIALNVDKTQADADIAALKAEMDTIGNKTIKITSDSSAARSDIDSAAADMDSHIKSTSSSWDNMTSSGRAASFSLVTALATIGVAMLPVAGAALSMGGALISSFSSAGVAGLAYGGVVADLVKGATTYNTNSNTLNQTLDAQKAQLATLTPGTAAYKSQLDAISQTQSQLNQLMASQQPIVIQVAQGITNMTNNWKDLVNQVAVLVGGQILSVLNDMSYSFKYLAPLIDDVAKAIQPMIDKFTQFAVLNPGDGIQKFVDWVIQYGIPNIKNMIDVVMNLGTTFVQIAEAFATEGVGLTATLARVTAELDKWGADGGFSRFADQVRSMMPEIKTFFDGLGEAAVKVTAAIWQMGPSSLTVLGIMLQLAAALPVGAVQALIVAFAAYKVVASAATAFFAVKTAVDAVKVAMTAAREVMLGFSAAEAVAADDSIALKVGAAASAVATAAMSAAAGVATAAETIWAAATQAMRTEEGELTIASIASAAAEGAQAIVTGIVTAATAAWDVVEGLADALALPLIATIGLIVLAVAAVGFAIYELVANWSTVWNALKVAAEAVWNALVVAWNATIGAIVKAFQVLTTANTWVTVWNGIKMVAETIWNALVVAWNATIGFIVKAFQTLTTENTWKQVWTTVQQVAQTIWNALKTAWTAFIGSFSIAWNAVSSAFSTAWNATWNAIKTAATVVWSALQVAWTAFVNALTIGWNATSAALSAAWDTVWNALKTAAMAVWTALQVAWQAFMNILETIYQTVAGTLQAAWTTFWNVIETVAIAVWNLLSAAWNVFMNGIETIYQTVSSVLQAAWQTFWTTIQTVATVIWNALQAAWQAFLTLIESTYDTISAAIQAAWQTFWTTVQTVATTIWDALQTAWTAFLNLIESTYDTISAAIQAAWQTFWTTVQTVATTIWDALQTAWTAFLDLIQSTYETISAAIQAAWQTFWTTLQTVATTIWDALQTAWTAFLDAVKSAYDTVSAALQSAWNDFWNTIKTTATTIWDALQTAWSTFLNAVKSVYDTISSALTSAWQNTWNTMKSALQTFVTDATAVWTGLKTAFEAPIHFVIDTVLNGGIIKAINWVISKLGGSGSAIPDIPLPFAEGGHVQGPGTGTSDSIPAMVSNGEYIMPAQRVQEIGVNNMHAMRSGAMPHFATGGLVSPGSTPADSSAPATSGTSSGLQDSDLETLFTGLIKSIGGAAAGAAGDAAGAVGSAAGAVAGAAKAVQNANIPVVSSIAGFLGGAASDASSAADAIAGALLGWGQSEFDQGTDAIINLITSKLLPGIPGGSPVFGAMAHGASEDFAKASLTSLRDDMSKYMFGQQQKTVASEVVAGVIPTASQKAIIDAALSADGVPAAQWPGWEAGMNTLIGRESSWNASAINNVDSNAAAGTPSEGLAQVIAPTFAAYRNPSLPNNLLDPVANVAAAINYINKVYGGIGNVQQANASLPPKGYDTGGPLPPGLTLTNNQTGTMEGVLNPTGLAAIGGLNALAALNSGSYGNSYQSGGYSYSGAASASSQRSGNVELNVTIVVPTATTADPQEVVDAVMEQVVPPLTVLLKQHVGG